MTKSAFSAAWIWRDRGRALPFVAVFAAAAIATQAGGKDRLIDTKQGKIKIETVASGLNQPWGLAFLPDGRKLVTEKPGRLRIVAKDGAVSAPIAGVPKVVALGQGGLVEATGNVSTATGGRPARLYRFRREVVVERPALGLRVKAGRG